MKLIEMKCKNCGAKLKVNPEEKDANCQFCGAEFKIDDETIHHKLDDAEQMGYELEKGKIRAREEAKEAKHAEESAILIAQEEEKRRKKIIIWWIIGWIICFPIPLTILIWKSSWDKNKKIIVTIILWVVLLTFGALMPNDTITLDNNEPSKAETKRAKEEKQTTNTKQKSKETIQTNDKKKSETNTKQDNYMDALRKCTIMEGAYIYTTGIGKKSDNVFNDARVTCQSWYEQWGEKEFVEIVNEDWETRKNEKVDGKPLTHYLDILGW